MNTCKAAHKDKKMDHERRKEMIKKDDTKERRNSMNKAEKREKERKKEREKEKKRKSVG